MNRAIFSITAGFVLCGDFLGTGVFAADADIDFFENRIRPLLVKRCYRCHGPEASSGGLRLDSASGWKKGGDSGPAIVPGKPEQSRLIRAVQYIDKELKMPPPDDGGRLKDREIADLIEWVRRGAADPRSGQPARKRDAQAARDHWAFQPVRRSEVPEGRNPIDYFVNRALEKRKLTAAPQADRRTLIRRLTYDLHGLPPSDAQRKAGALDFTTLIDELLASPRYGERWGRHWLDVARYADTKDGVLMYGDNRIRPFAYTYRDYVIRSFNEDKPFDRFIHEQIAADQLGLNPDAPELAAMGFLTLGRMFDSNRHDVIDDQIDTVTRGLLGLTVSCARCHDHKFDPIPTADYYSLHGVFASSEEPIDRPRIEVPTDEGQAFEETLAEKLAHVRKLETEHYNRLLKTARDRTADYLVRVATTEPDLNETAIFFLSLLPEMLRPQVVYRWRQLIARRATADDPVFAPWHDLMKNPELRAAAWRKRGVDPRVIHALVAARPQSAEEVARSYGQLLLKVFQDDSVAVDDPLKSLLAGRESPVWFPKKQLYLYLSRTDKDAFRGKVRELDVIAVKDPKAAARAMVLVDSQPLYDPVIFRRGDPSLPGRQVPRQFLKVATTGIRQPFANGAGRLDLARSITSPQNPLTARVLANRVWMHHFGEPLVENPSDFGLRTDRPGHSELLDFLASELIRNGWRLKPLHRLILTSATWQRSSSIAGSPKLMAQQEADPDNRWLWRANRRRLDLESMRDTVLAVSGQLDLTMFGRPVSIDDASNRRRTVYALVERQSIPDVVRNFDFPSPDASAAKRNVTTVPQQALFAMNSEFIRTAAKHLAERVQKTSTDRVGMLYRMALGRDPGDDERQAGAEFTVEGSWADYAQILLMTNEIMFVD